MTKIFGIPNCDSIKKCKKWLTDNDIEFDFHDYKKLGVPEKELRSWVKQVGWEILLNKRGTTWRKLADSVKDTVNEKSAIQIMIDNPSIIKRPVLKLEDHIEVGFKPEQYSEIFK